MIKKDGEPMNLMILLMFKQRYYELYLPNENNQTVSIRITPENSGLSQDVLITLEVWDSEWFFLENESIMIADKNSRLKSIALSKDLLINATVHGTKEVFVISVNGTNEGNILFDKYLIGQAPITIGSSPNSTVRLNEKFISPEHAVITLGSNGEYILKDLNSVNGTFLNGRLVASAEKLNYGDIIYVIGLKIVFLGNFLAINNPNHHCTITALKPIHIVDEPTKKVNKQKIADSYFMRIPRPLKALNQETIEIEACPPANKQKRQPLMFTIGPAFTMVIPMAMGAVLSGGSGFGAAGLTMSIGAAVVGTFWALININYSKKEEKLEQSKRIQGYQQYLSEIVSEIERRKKYNSALLENQFPVCAEYIQWVNEGSRRLWEKSVSHSDFLNIRLGTGRIPNPNKITIPKRSFTTQTDSFSGEPHKIKATLSSLENMPINLSLLDNQLVGVISSNRQDTLNIARVLSLQIASAHPYTEVRMGYVYNSNESEKWSFAKWLPHTWAPDGKLRLIANEKNHVGDVIYHLLGVIRDRLDLQKDHQETQKVIVPHYLLMVGEPELLVGESIEKFIYAPKKEMGITTILFVDAIDKLPNNCTTIILNQVEKKGVYSLNNAFPEQNEIQFDQVSHGALNRHAKALSNIKIRESLTEQAIPEMLTFLDMYQTSKIENIDVYRRWQKNRTYESMKSLVGYKGGEQPLYLDIHEKYHGPHGLVAGTTGSGKSETLQTYILSLAINYHPHEISFILIDYKGGGMAASFDGLPHLAGIITNLGGNQTNRALASINSEIRRRQTVFSEYKVKHIDTYIELFRNGQAQEPMPHLLIIADEFAELKKEQPDFVRALVSAARVGRSLGVHLILATQKPSGVVDDEIWGNTRFRLCLRVADKQDSNEMIKRPDAAFITGSGRAYFQVGHDEIFEEFQSGWSGAAYEPQIPYSDEKNSKVEMINLIGKPSVLKGKKKKTQPTEASVPQKKVTQLEAIVSYTARLASQKAIEPMRQIWLPPLPQRLFLADLEGFGESYWSTFGWKTGEFSLAPIIGLADDPVHQSQYPVKIDFLREGHVLICGSPGSGKTTLLQTMLFSTTQMYSPEWVSIYIIDMNSRTMGIWSTLPHVGAVAFEGEDEKIEQICTFIKNELGRRKQLLSEKNIGSFKEYSHLYKDVNAILFIVDNFIAFSESYGETEELFVQLTREAASYGIYMILTATNPSDIRMKIRQNIRYGIGLQLGDRFEYEEAIGERTEVIAEAKTPGRGIIKAPKPVEFQTALCVRSKDVLQMNQVLKEEFELMKKGSTVSAAKEISQSVKEVSFEDFMARDDVRGLSELELGAFIDSETNKVLTIHLANTFCYTIGGAGKSGKTNLLKSLGVQAARKSAKIFVFDGIDQELKGYAEEVLVERYMTNAEELFALMEEVLVNEFRLRNPIVSTAREQGANLEDALKDHPRIVILINDMAAFCNAIYHSDKEMSGFMELALVKGIGHKINFIAGITNSDYDEFLTYSTMRSFVASQQGVHLGGLVDQQGLFEFEMSTQDRARKLPPGTGVISVTGKIRKVITPLIASSK